MKVPPTPPDEQARLQALHAYGVVDTPPEDAFDDLTAMAAHICEAPVALISLVEEDRQWFKSALGLDWTETDRTLSFCAHAILHPEVFVVEDAQRDDRFADHPFVTGEPRIRFYAGCPLVTPDGHALGTLCVIDHAPRVLHADHEQALRVLSRHVMTLLELRRRTREVTDLRARLDEGVLECMPGIFCLVDEDNRFVRWNENFQVVTGHDADEIRTLHPLDLVPEAERALVAERIQQAFTHGAAEVEATLRAKDGTCTPYQFTVRRIDLAGRPHIVGMGVDITGRKAAEAERDRLFELSPDMFCIAGFDGRFKQLNPAWERTLGHSRHELMTQPFLDFVHPEDREKTLTEYDRVMKGIPSDRFTNRYRCRDGSWKWLSWNVFAMTSEGEIYAVARDVTAEKELEEQVRRIQKLDSIGRLAAGIAHDFNNVLTVQQSIVSMVLAEPNLPPSVAADLREVLQACDRASALTRQLLLFSREQVLRVRSLDLNAVVKGLGQMLRRIIGSDVAFICEAEDALPPVRADAGMIEQVLMNLAVNARDAMPGGGRLTIATSAVELDDDATRHNPEARPGTFVRLRVSDTGTGIPPDVLEHMFEPFFTTKDVGAGTGLGLATVHGIVRQHQGWIEVDSQQGAGTTFRLYFPAATSMEVHASEAAEASEAAPGGHETILLVEDESTVRSLAERILGELGYRVLAAPDGAQALDTWAEHQGSIDLLLTDMVMPHGISGRVLAERLRRERPDLRVLFASGYSTDTATLRESLGARFALLQKPYTRTRLAQAVRACLDAPS